MLCAVQAAETVVCSPTFRSHWETIVPNEDDLPQPEDVGEALISALDPEMREENSCRYELVRQLELGRQRQLDMSHDTSSLWAGFNRTGSI